MSAPTIPILFVRDWVISAPLSGELLLAAAVYLYAVHAARRWPPVRTLAFLAGLLTIAVALESGLDAYDDRLLSVHMVQHLLLIDLAPPLLLYGRPVHLALKTLPGHERRALGRGVVALGRVARPWVCLVLFTVIVLAIHVPVFFEAAVRHQTLHELEHAAFLLAGLILWWPLLGMAAPRHRLGAIGELVYLTLAMLPMTLIGTYLDRAPALLYPVYAAPTRALGLSPLLDQQRAGAIMWVAGTTLMACGGLIAVLATMLAAERRQRARELHGAALTLLLMAIAMTLGLHATTAVAQTAAPTKRPDAPGAGALTVATVTSPALVREGRQLYDQSCASCHGLELQGRRATAPSLHGVGAGPVDFYLSTGRMPLANPRAEPTRSTPAFDNHQINAIIAFVRQLAGGPPAPTADPKAGDLALGFSLFEQNCAGCHSIVARGGITLGAQVPDLQQATAQQIAEAVRMGPYLMPKFSALQLDQRDLDSIARYVIWTRHPDNPGGWGLYNIGPIPEGIVAWFVGLLALVVVARLIGERTG